MHLTLGAVIAVLVISWLLGLGDIAKGFRRFYIGQWLLLAVYLTVFAGILVYGLGEKIRDSLRHRGSVVTREIHHAGDFGNEVDHGFLSFVRQRGDNVCDGGCPLGQQVVMAPKEVGHGDLQDTGHVFETAHLGSYASLLHSGQRVLGDTEFACEFLLTEADLLASSKDILSNNFSKFHGAPLVYTAMKKLKKT